MAIHGASVDNMKPALDGIFDTLTSKFKTADLTKKILSDKSKLSNKIKKNAVVKWTSTYYKSSENILRSLNV